MAEALISPGVLARENDNSFVSQPVDLIPQQLLLLFLVVQQDQLLVVVHLL